MPSSDLRHALPSPTVVTTIAIQPTLAVLNAIPLGPEICVEIGMNKDIQGSRDKGLVGTEVSYS